MSMNLKDYVDIRLGLSMEKSATSKHRNKYRRKAASRGFKQSTSPTTTPPSPPPNVVYGNPPSMWGKLLALLGAGAAGKGATKLLDVNEDDRLQQYLIDAEKDPGTIGPNLEAWQKPYLAGYFGLPQTTKLEKVLGTPPKLTDKFEQHRKAMQFVYPK
jgi:hypothetical protein